MININTLDDTMFTVDGVSHYRKFFSNVKGNLVRVYNSFTAQNILIDYIDYSQISLNGVVYPSAIALQTELLQVIYAYSTTGSPTISQDNKFKTMFLSYSGTPSLVNFANAVNALPSFTIDEKQIALFVAGKVPYLTYKFVFNNLGKGNYGIGGTPVNSNDIQVVYAGSENTNDVINSPSTQFFNLGEIGGTPVYTVVNNSAVPFNIQNQEDGYVVFKTTVSGVEANYLFLGAGGTYGLGQLQTTVDDFQLLSDSISLNPSEKEDSANKTNDLADYQSTVKFPTFNTIVTWIKEKLIDVLGNKTILADADSLVIGDSEDLNKTKKIPWLNFKGLFKTVGGISIFGIGNIDTTTAGLTSRIYFTADNVTVGAGTFFASSLAGKGTTATGSPTALVLGDNVKAFFDKDVLSIAQPTSTIGYAGNYSANINFSEIVPASSQARFTMEIYRCDTNGTPIASGVAGAITGDHGVTVVAVLDSGIITMTSGAISNVSLTGNLPANITLNTGERLRYHLSAQKVGTGGGNATFNAYYGNTRNSFYDVPVAITTDSVLNKSTVSGTTSTDVFNSLKTSIDANTLAISTKGDMTTNTAQTVSGVKTFLNFMLGLRNVANTFTSFFTNSNTASRTYTLPDKSGTVAMTSDITPQITITTAVSITTETNDASGIEQKGKNVIIDNGANAINLTVNGGAGFVSSYVKHGTGAITFVQGSGRTLVQVDSTNVLNGAVGSTATISSIGTTDYLRISNA